MPDMAMPDMGSSGDAAVADQTADVATNPDAGATPVEQPPDVVADPAVDLTAAEQPSDDVAAGPDAAQAAPGGDEGTAAETKPPGAGLNHGALAEELIAERQHQAMGDASPAPPPPAAVATYTVTEGAHAGCMPHCTRCGAGQVRHVIGLQCTSRLTPNSHARHAIVSCLHITCCVPTAVSELFGLA